MIFQSDIIELQNQTINQANISFDRIVELLYFTVGTFLAILAIIGIAQVIISNNRLKKLKGETINEVAETYNLHEIKNIMRELNLTKIDMHYKEIDLCIKNGSYFEAILSFKMVMDLIDVTDSKFTMFFVLRGITLMRRLALEKDKDVIANFEANYNNRWEHRMKILEDYIAILHEIKKNKTETIEGFSTDNALDGAYKIKSSLQELIYKETQIQDK